MAERAQWQSVQEEQEREQFFVLASELEPGPEGRRQRLEEKTKVLLSAGVLLPSTDPWDGEGIDPTLWMTPPESYPGGVGPCGGNTGDTDGPPAC